MLIDLHPVTADGECLQRMGAEAVERLVINMQLRVAEPDVHARQCPCEAVVGAWRCHPIGRPNTANGGYVMGAMKDLMIQCQEALEAIRTGPDQSEEITEQAEALFQLLCAEENYRLAAAANRAAASEAERQLRGLPYREGRYRADLDDAVADLICAFLRPAPSPADVA